MGDKLFFFMICLQFVNALSVKFEVGGDQQWCIPNAKDDDDNVFNAWASKNRFNVNDSLHFKYSQDSVLEVTEADYEQCQSSHPLFYSNSGDTEFTFDRPGLFYFISGISGHCERGQKLIIKVLDTKIPPNPKAPTETSGSPCSDEGAKTKSGSARGTIFVPIFFAMSFVGLILFYFYALG